MLIYWVWLSQCLDICSAHLIPLLNKYGDPKRIYKTSISNLQDSYLLSANELKRLNNKTLDKAESIINECNESKIEIITFDDERYPKNLREITNPPACLYVKGSLKNFNDRPTICIVGTRKISEYGLLVSWSLSARLAAGGMTVLSGGAMGGDAAAHEGALAVGGTTIAVLPCGINFDYLKTNQFLRNLITDSGCIVSEFPPDTPLYRNAFQIRNRLLSAMSLGVVVTEAPEKSGTLITVKNASEQGRDVFVITGRPDDPNYAGSNALLRDGAKPVFTADDIFDEYIDLYPHIIEPEKAKKTNISRLYKALHFPNKETLNPVRLSTLEDKPDGSKKTKKIIDETLPKNVKMVYNYIDSETFSIDDIITCGVNFEDILSAITQLELYGYIKAVPGGRYTIIFKE